jgi:hypothetical protein
VDPQPGRLAVRCPGAVWLSPKSILFSQMLLSDLGVDFRAVQMTSAPAKILLDSTIQQVVHHDDTGLVHVITLVQTAVTIRGNAPSSSPASSACAAAFTFFP